MITGMSFGQMTPAVERLVRLMLLLPSEYRHPLWESAGADCDDTTEVSSLRWFVGDTAKMSPQAAPRNLANAVLAVFGSASEKTLQLITDAILDDPSPAYGPKAGAAWVNQALAAAIEVLAQYPSLKEALQEAKDRWTLGAR